MKKKLISFCIICIMCVFMIQPMNVKAYGESTWQENFVNAVKTITGLNGISTGQNATMTGLSTDDFYSLLYNTNLTWNNYSGSASGEHTFKPSDLFTKSEWINLCKTGQSQYTAFNGFNIADCFIDSGYMTDNGDSYTFNDFPKLDEGTNAKNPIEGVEVITNFSDFSTRMPIPTTYNYYLNQIKDNCLSNASRLIMINGYIDNDYGYGTTLVSYNPVDFIAVYQSDNSSSFYPYILYLQNGTWYTRTSNSASGFFMKRRSGNDTRIILVRNNNMGNNFYDIGQIISEGELYVNTINSPQNYKYNSTQDLKFWSNYPVVYGNTVQNIKNYYYWMKGSPTGIYYNTSNIINQTINKSDIQNINWGQTYNNYITDVSNYYDTTQNIDNSQLIEYISQQTTYTNITNNYITYYNTNSGNESGSVSGNDSIISNSWLERIYNKLQDIWNLMLGRGNTDDNTPWITDDGIKNAIDLYPSADLFPDVPIDKFISTAEDFTVDLLGQKISEIIIDTIPFCFIGILEGVAEALKADPEPPKWEIPFKIERLNIDESVTIDFTDPAWETVHTIWIVLFVIILVAFLAFLSWKLIMLVSNVFT